MNEERLVLPFLGRGGSTKTDADLDALIVALWPLVASFAMQGYQTTGRGALVLDFYEPSGGYPEPPVFILRYFASGQLVTQKVPGLDAALHAYDPEREAIQLTWCSDDVLRWEVLTSSNDWPTPLDAFKSQSAARLKIDPRRN